MQQSALIVVDVQNDFCPAGALGIAEGDQVVPVLNRYIQKFSQAGRPIFMTRDWHPEKTSHFKSGGGPWPSHCVRHSRGAEFHPDLNRGPKATIVSKGTEPDEDSYSAFHGHDAAGTPLAALLRQAEIKTIYVGGLATDYCVKYTVLDALHSGFGAVVLCDAIRGVNLAADDSARALDEMRAAGATLLGSFDDLVSP
jgi:nicotinamidase/pyrazinamidase